MEVFQKKEGNPLYLIKHYHDAGFESFVGIDTEKACDICGKKGETIHWEPNGQVNDVCKSCIRVEPTLGWFTALVEGSK